MQDQPSRFKRRKPQDLVTRRDEALAFVASDETWQAPAWFERVAVVLVEPHPRLEQFDESARARILDVLAAELTQSRAVAPHAPLVLS